MKRSVRLHEKCGVTKLPRVKTISAHRGCILIIPKVSVSNLK